MFTFAQKMCVFAIASIGLFAQSTPVVAGAGNPHLRDGRRHGWTSGPRERAQSRRRRAGRRSQVCIGHLSFGMDRAAAQIPDRQRGCASRKKRLSWIVFGDKDLSLSRNVRREIRATISLPPLCRSTATSYGS